MRNLRGPERKEWMGVVLWSVLLWACTESTRAPLRAPDPPPQVLTQACSGLRIQVTLVQGRRSALVADVLVTDTAGQIPSDIRRVVLAFTQKTQANTTTTLVAQLRDAGHYVPTSEFLLTPASWTVEVTVRRANDIAVNCVFSFDV